MFCEPLKLQKYFGELQRYNVLQRGTRSYKLVLTFH